MEPVRRDFTNVQLGNYRLVRLLGHGGFADVYLGEHIHLNTLAAIKMLHTELTRTEEKNFVWRHALSLIWSTHILCECSILE